MDVLTVTALLLDSLTSRFALTRAAILQGEANELRKQLGVARSLRNGSSPEWEEKMTRLKQLREMRKSILDKIAEYKQGRQGLECKTEQELDDRIAEMEHSIQHGDMSLTEEKATVRNIAKLQSQREKIRELQGQQESLAQMEAEARKIKAVIDEVSTFASICLSGGVCTCSIKLLWQWPPPPDYCGQ